VEGARAAEAGDLDAIVALARGAVVELADLRGGSVWRRREARQEPLEPSLKEAVGASGPDSAAVVGTIDAAVVGYGLSHIEALDDGSKLAVVTDLYVDPEARGIGIGEAMMDMLVAHAEAAGAIGIDALALPGDRATKNFFETFGLKARAIVVHRPLGGQG
jgi:ribosomal protein S18 acetylase RimI-like enzyme